MKGWITGGRGRGGVWDYEREGVQEMKRKTEEVGSTEEERREVEIALAWMIAGRGGRG